MRLVRPGAVGSAVLLAVTTTVAVGGCSVLYPGPAPSSFPTVSVGPPETGAPPSVPSPQVSPTAATITATGLVALEDAHDAVIGLFAQDLRCGDRVVHRSTERFALASTVKVVAATAVLRSASPDVLDEQVVVPGETLAHSPVTEQNRGASLTLGEVIDAALVESDNTAGNLLLERLGGPGGLTATLREAGDDVTDSSRREPDLNDHVPGDPRDTTTPQAIATLLADHLVRGELEPWAAGTVLDAMERSTTGLDRIRAGVPEGWSVADKTGTGGHGTRNDVAIVHRPDGSAVVLAVLTRAQEPDGETTDALVAEVARRAVDAMPPPSC